LIWGSRGFTAGDQQTVAKEYEKRRRAELERAAAGMPTEEKAPRLRSVAEVSDVYLEGYRLSHRPKSILFAAGRLKQVKRLVGGGAVGSNGGTHPGLRPAIGRKMVRAGEPSAWRLANCRGPLGALGVNCGPN